MVELKPNYTGSELDEQLKKTINAALQNYRAGLIKTGKSLVADAKANGRYRNKTGNLRSSIGFVVAVGKQIIAQEFSLTLTGQTGMKKGIEMAKALVFENPNQQEVLIAVAAMDYARTLESKGRNVLTASSLSAIDDLKSLLKSIMGGK